MAQARAGGGERGGLGGRNGGAVNQMAGKLGEVFGGVVAAQHRCTHRAGSLAEGNNQNIGLHAGGCGAAFSLIAEHAEAVGIIEQQPSAVFAA